MDLDIAGRRAIVCASSKGLGKACAIALAAEGVDVTINGRDAATLDATAAEMRVHAKGRVDMVVADVTTEAGRDALLSACPDPDILINNAGGPPTGNFRDWDRDAWIRAVDANMLAPIFLMKATVDAMASRGFGRIVNITTAGVKMPGTFETLGLSLGARSGLTAFSVMLARSLASSGVTINGLLPGRFATDRLRTTIAADAAKRGLPEAEATARASAEVPAKRFGSPAEFGAICAFLCSAPRRLRDGGQNLLVDGGVFSGDRLRPTLHARRRRREAPARTPPFRPRPRWPTGAAPLWRRPLMPPRPPPPECRPSKACPVRRARSCRLWRCRPRCGSRI